VADDEEAQGASEEDNEDAGAAADQGEAPKQPKRSPTTTGKPKPVLDKKARSIEDYF
jgi:hypothetical protein